MAIKLRRGLEIDRMPIVFAQGEIIYVIDTKKVYIGDGVTFGGNLVTGEELLTALDDVQISSLANNNLLSYNSSLFKWQNKAVTTADIPEVTNLYFTNERVDDRVAQMLLAGANVTLTYNDSANTLTIDAAGNVQSVNTKTGAVVLTTTDITEGTNEYHTSARVRAVILTGLSLVTNAVISATDSVLIAFGKLQAQITANLSTLTSHTSNTSNPHATTKAQVGLGNADDTSDANKPVSTATQTALNAKQDTLVSNTNIKTVNSTSLLGSGDIAVQPTLVSGTNIKTVNGTTLLGSGDLVISTGITIGTTPITLGAVGRVLFEGAGNVVSGSANLFWDNTNARLGVGTSSPSAIIHSVGSVTATSLIARGAFLNNTLVASANNDVLVGLDIQPTFTNGAFTTPRNIGLRVQSGRVVIGTDTASAYPPTLLVASNQTLFATTPAHSGLWVTEANSGNYAKITFFSNSYPTNFAVGQTGTTYTTGMQNKSFLHSNTDIWFTLSGSGSPDAANPAMILFNATKNISINSTTDAGYKLDVNGTARISSDLTVGSSTQKINLGQYGSIQSTTAANVFLKFESNGIILSSQNVLQLKTGNVLSGAAIIANAGMIVGRGDEVGMDASAKLQVDSTSRGFLPPRMTTTQKNAIASPATALQVYDTTLNVISIYNGTNWVNGTGAPNVRHDYVEPYSYVGTATQSSLEGSNVWKITRIQNLTDANVLITTALNVSWSNRLTHTYS